MVRAAAAAMMAVLPIAAQAGCWTSGDIDAARVRDLQTGLRIASERCEASGHGAAAAYDAFLSSNSRAVAAMNQRLKARFVTAYGGQEGMRRFADFTASLASAYQGQEVTAQTCAGIVALSREAAASDGSVAGLLRIADRVEVAPSLPGGACSAVYATR
jgi:hypothetical protein